MSYRGRRVLVTGADGFIGSHLAEALVRANAEVTARPLRALCPVPADAESLLAPRSHGAFSKADTLPSLAPAVPVIDRIHGRTADSRADSEPARPAGLAEICEPLALVGNLADARIAGFADNADLA